MKEYTVAYIKDGEEYAYDYYKPGAAIKEIVDVLTYEINRYGKDCDEVSIFDTYDEEAFTFYYEVVNNYGHYELIRGGIG